MSDATEDTDGAGQAAIAARGADGDDGLSHARTRSISGEPVEVELPRPTPVRAAIVGRTVTVEPLDAERHGPDLYPLVHGDAERERVWDYLFSGPFADYPSYEGYLAANAVSADPVWYALRPHGSGRAEGVATLMEIRPATGVIEIGHINLSTALQRSVEATEGLYLLMRHALTDLGYRRLEWKCNALNHPSRRAAARLGFSFEGVFYRHMTPKGHNRDTAWFSIIAEEWPAIDANFQAWLDPANFDADGRQLRSLGDMNRALV